MTNEERAAALNEIAAQISVCTLCDLHKTRTRTVPGAGNIRAEILFIGEGPGLNEDKRGLPFVGASGDYLEKLLALIGLNRDQVFITNVVKCRPPENRDPLPIEMATCKDYLDRQIDVIDPLVIATLGRFSMGRYFPGDKITQIHGKPKIDDGLRRAYLPFFHPAAVLRDPGKQSDMELDFRRLPTLVEQMRELRAKAAPAAPAVPTTTPGKADEPKQMNLF